jgi:hypothetical protein
MNTRAPLGTRQPTSKMQRHIAEKAVGQSATAPNAAKRRCFSRQGVSGLRTGQETATEILCPSPCFIKNSRVLRDWHLGMQRPTLEREAIHEGPDRRHHRPAAQITRSRRCERGLSSLFTRPDCCPEVDIENLPADLMCLSGRHPSLAPAVRFARGRALRAACVRMSALFDKKKAGRGALFPPAKSSG